MLAAILICGTMTMLTSCSVNDTPSDYIITPEDENLARITETIRHEGKKARSITSNILRKTPSATP